MGDAPLPTVPAPTTRAQDALMVGVYLVAGMGVSAAGIQTILREIGTAMGRFPTATHGCTWLGLAPRHDRSGGTVLRSQTQQVVNRATHACRHAAQSVSRSDSAMGA